MSLSASFSDFANNIQPESAFTVLAVAKKLVAAGKDVIELEIGDSPFAAPRAAVEVASRSIYEGNCRYGPSIGLSGLRQAAARYVNNEYDLQTSEENIVVGPGAKFFEQLFCEAFLNPGDSVLVFSPYFPTYPANIARRGAHMVLSNLKQSREFRPNLDDVKRFLDGDANPKAIFLNSPHNPTGGVALPEDLIELAKLIRGRDIAVFSDEPYDRMVWNGRHHSLVGLPGMFQQAIAVYSFSKSFSMGGWRLGFAVTSPQNAAMLGKLTNTSVSCVPPFTQEAGIAALERGIGERDQQMKNFGRKIELLVKGLNQINDVACLMPGGTFYVFPSVAGICNRNEITSHGLAMYLLEGADNRRGVACLGGECFGDAGAGFLRLSCAEADDRLLDAVRFIETAVRNHRRIGEYLRENRQFRLSKPYAI